QLAGTNYLTLSEVEVFGSTQGSRAAQVNWLVTDHLGTPRMLADLTGSLSGIKRHDYLPFGEELSAGMGGRTTAQGYSQVDNVRQGFTGYEKDIETGLDFAQARYYASTQGRFISVDPALDSAQSAMPQSWNRYTYCLNNPLRFIDPTGMRWAQKYNEEDKKWYYSWFGKDEDYNNAIENDGFSAVDFDESKPYEFLARGGSETQLWVILNPDGTNILDSRGTPGAAPGIDMMEGQAFELAAGNVAGKAITSVFNRVFGSLFSRASSVTNPVPSTLARAIPGEGPFPTLGRIGAEEVFVTAADDIASMSASQIGPRLGIRNSDVFTIIEFPTPRVGLACPINRADPGFVGFGRTTGGAREFVLPNGPIPANATTRIVR
ncbi:MAG TPA: polymorphic toxin type 10 domain-containing protein, partial [Pyrinomonadaceae bacterium]